MRIEGTVVDDIAGEEMEVFVVGAAVGNGSVEGGGGRAEKDASRRLWSFVVSDWICLGIRQLNGTIEEKKTTTNWRRTEVRGAVIIAPGQVILTGVNSPQTKNMSPNNGTRRLSCRARLYNTVSSSTPCPQFLLLQTRKNLHHKLELSSRDFPLVYQLCYGSLPFFTYPILHFLRGLVILEHILGS